VTVEEHPDLRVGPDRLLAAHAAARDRVLRDRASHVRAGVPLAVFGTASLLSGVIAALADDGAYRLFWGVAAPVAFVLVSAHYARLEARSSLRPVNPWVALAIAGVTVGLAAVIAGVGTSSGPFVVAALAYLAFGLLWHNVALLACSSLCAICAATIVAADPTSELAWLGVSTGAVQLAAAVAETGHRRRQRPGGPSA
jgi:hypothetical protein